MCACVCACVCVCMHTCVLACIYACVHASVRCLYECARQCVEIVGEDRGYCSLHQISWLFQPINMVISVAHLLSQRLVPKQI